MVRLFRLFVDAAVAALLAGVLLAVYLMDGPKPPPPAPPPVAIAPPKLKLAVTPSEFEEMGALLRGLGEGYEFLEIDESELTDPSRTNHYDAIFLTCRKPEGTPAPALVQALRAYVAEHGGTLYASDLRFDTLRAAFPEFVDATKAGAQGMDRHLDATVEDPDLREVLGPRAPLHFDREEWRPATFRGAGVTTYLRGSFRINGGGAVPIEAPLLVKLACGQGSVIFTSFHNGKQENSELEKKLLKYLVLSTVMAGVESRANQDMVRGDFSPRTRSLLSVAPGEQSVTRSFEHAQPGR
jgi:hypothetical protein